MGLPRISLKGSYSICLWGALAMPGLHAHQGKGYALIKHSFLGA